MKHEKPQRQPRDLNTPGRGLAKVLKRAVRGAGEVLEDGIVGSKAQVKKVVGEVAASGGSLVPGDRKSLDPYRAIVNGEAGRDGKSTDVIQLIFAGDTVFAVVRKSSGSQTNRKIDEISLVELPYGHNKNFAADGRDLSPARVLFRIDPSSLRNRMVGAYVQEWETFHVGRRANEDPDLHMSNVHFDFSVMSDGRMDIEDMNSTNGTTVLGLHELSAVQNQRGVMPTQTELLVRDLMSSPTKYDPDLAGQKIVAGANAKS
jgi:hypothetical protein